MNDLCPGTLLFYCLRISFCPAGSHDAAMSEKGCRVGVAFRITVMQWLIVGVQKGALGALFFILLPSLLYAKGSREKNIALCQFASVNAVLGIVLNRFTICMIAYNWQLPSADRYFPSFTEIMITVFVITMIVTCYRFIVYHMPILYQHPDYKD